MTTRGILRYCLIVAFTLATTGCGLETALGLRGYTGGNGDESGQSEELNTDAAPGGAIYTFTDVAFEFDKANLRPQARVAVDRLVRYLNENPTQEIILEGFTDNVGPSHYNLELSQRRAEAVRDSLVRNGIAPTRIVARGLGEAKPLATNNTEAGRKRNRRVEVILYKTKS